MIEEEEYSRAVPNGDTVFSFQLYSSKERKEAMTFIQKMNKHNNAFASNMRFSTRTIKDGKNKYHVVFVTINTPGSYFDAAVSVINFLCEKIAITKNI